MSREMQWGQKLTQGSPARAVSSTDTQRHFEHEQVTSPVPLAHPPVQWWIDYGMKQRNDTGEDYNLGGWLLVNNQTIHVVEL